MNRRIRKKVAKRRIEKAIRGLIDYALDRRRKRKKSNAVYWKAMTAITENGHRERRNYSNRLHKHWLHDTRTHWKIHVPHAYN